MKKLIIILFIPFALNAQIRTFQAQESFAFTEDKKLHTFVAFGMTAGIYTGAYLKTKNTEAALGYAIGFPFVLCLGKEVADRHFNIADLGYGLGSIAVTVLISHGITKWIEKRKAKKIKKRFNLYD